MKILKIFGIVAGLHALALVLIVAWQGCSSNSAARPQPTDTAAAPTSAAVAANDSPAIAVPVVAGPPAADAAAAPAALTVPDAVVFSPTRPGTAAASALQEQPAADVTPASTYVVVKGDSLWSIAKKHHLKVHALAMANNLPPGAGLHLGQKLIIPGPPSTGALAASPAPAAAAPPVAAPTGEIKHIVRPGETLGAIARKYGVRVGAIATKNNISDPAKIHPGQTLIIPGGHEVAKAAAAPAPAAAAEGPSSVEPVPAAAPPAQDLDAGLNPADTTVVPPVVKVDQPAPAGQPNP